MEEIPSLLLHGSKNPNIDRLSPSRSDEKWPFGPAVYLTGDPDVAGCYVGNAGAIYEVEVAGNNAMTIALDRKWREQSVDARMAIKEAFRVAGMEIPLGMYSESEVRKIVDALVVDGRRGDRNRLLGEKGIWLLYGHVDQYEDSGLCDRGVQYAVIVEAAIVGQRIWSNPVLQRPGLNGECS